MTAPGLAVHGLACSRGGRRIFSDLSFSAGMGALVLVRGANGSGKTSLLRILAGLAWPDAGEITWQGCDPHDEERGLRSALAWLGHLDGLKQDLSGRENLSFHAALVESNGDGEQALDRCGVLDVADRPCRTLSMGQRRRTALARLLLSRVPLWILDEPLTGLDVEGQELVQRMVTEHCEKGGLAVVTSHQPFAMPDSHLEVTL